MCVGMLIKRVNKKDDETKTDEANEEHNIRIEYDGLSHGNVFESVNATMSASNQEVACCGNS